MIIPELIALQLELLPGENHQVNSILNSTNFQAGYTSPQLRYSCYSPTSKAAVADSLFQSIHCGHQSMMNGHIPQ